MPEKHICNLTFSEIKELAELVSDKKLGKIDIRIGEDRLVIKDREYPAVQMPLPAAVPVQAAVPSQPAPSVQTDNSASQEDKASADEEISGNTVKAPIVGTFYAAPSPEKPPFVSVGQQVKKGDVLFIIESMKLMNEIQSEYDGTVKQILVSDASAVEYDQPIMIIG
ncbi:MAG: acetyl-CoA carboxylase biotin carboxyl carrier protein [Ruminococcus sp.]|jgi:acetyl-CoA carboxylase biotin carboxyl carrier protein|nr:acetyl-CoA carboxylase biotin carboxyl carrier protein [Ruminococcus sp.]